MSRLLFSLCTWVAFVFFGASQTEADTAKTSKDAPPKTGGSVSGIVIDKKGDTSVKVKVDGKDEPITYVVADSDKKARKALAGIFTVARVRLAYKVDGETRQLTGIQRIGRKGTGTMTGVVVTAHEWWIEVKPRGGAPEGFAPTYPKEKWQATLDKFKELKKGDTVVIQYYTDFERSRILSIRKVEK